MARPEIISGFTGRISLTTSDTSAGMTRPHAIHIAPSRAIIAHVTDFSGKVLVVAS